jgi:uncharacterized membrane protein YbhN (UPF0104 family)
MTAKDTDAADSGPRKRSRGWLRPIAALAVLLLAAFLLHRSIGQYGLQELLESVRSIPLHRLAFSAAFAAASYACLTGFDFLAVKYVGREIPYRYIARTSFASLSLGHTIGFAALSSGAIRYRFYARYGLKPGEIARIIVFCGVTVGLGLMVLGGSVLCLHPDMAAERLQVEPWIAVAIGAACLLTVAGYIAVCGSIRRAFRVFRFRFTIPPLRLALGQLVIGAANFAMVAACLHQAVAGATDAPYLGVATAYVLANVATLASHVPGGLGVIEGVVLYFIPGETVIGAVIVFRLVYYLIPLVLGGILFAATELTTPPRGKGAFRQS